MAKNRSAAIGAVFLIMLILVGDAIVGLGSSHAPTPSSCPSNSPSPCLTQVQSGRGTCTIAVGQFTCVSTQINFNPAYSQIPLIFAGDVNNTGTLLNQNNGIVDVGTILFIATDPATPWVMPAAKTELFGTTFHEWRMNNTAGNLQTTGFGVDCHSSGIAVTQPQPELFLQQSTDGGVTFNDFLPNAGINVTNVNCPVGGATLWISQGVTAFARTGTLVLRVVGINGDGINSIFLTNIWINTAVLTANANLVCFPTFTAVTTAAHTKIGCTEAFKQLAIATASFWWMAGIKG